MAARLRQLQSVLQGPEFTENVYYPTPSGDVVAASRVVGSTKRMPFYGVVSISLDDEPISLEADGTACSEHAVAFYGRKLTFLPSPARFVAIITNPLHENFRAFTRLSPQALPLDRVQLLAKFKPLLEDAVAGTLTPEAAKTLFDGVQSFVAPLLPTVTKLKPNARIIQEALWANPGCSLSDLAERLGLSYHRTSHYFGEAFGISVRSYQLWQKLYSVGPMIASGVSLTEAALAAGFIDSSHFSNSYQNAYGRSPSDVFRSRRVTVHSTEPTRDTTVIDSDSLPQRRLPR